MIDYLSLGYRIAFITEDGRKPREVIRFVYNLETGCFPQVWLNSLLSRTDTLFQPFRKRFAPMEKDGSYC